MQLHEYNQRKDYPKQFGTITTTIKTSHTVKTIADLCFSITCSNCHPITDA